MHIEVLPTPEELGVRAATLAASLIRRAISEKGSARVLLSTGSSQFETISALSRQDVDWARVEAFHLDEYAGMSESHPASFVRYLKERFASRAHLKAFHFVDGSRPAADVIAELSEELSRGGIDVGLIGIGENAHIAFNDPPADFEDDSCYKIVELDEACRNQQLHEGWFETLDGVPRRAISMTVRQIMKCASIISAVPHLVKADAVRKTLSAEAPDPMVPASILKSHPDIHLFLDHSSASLLDEQTRNKHLGGKR
jgi:glucosamine-6-phosphate deaminase